MAKLFTPYDFYMFASTQMKVLQKNFYSGHGKGIYRREFHWIPNHGRESINRRIRGCNRLGDVGIKKLHFFESIGCLGFVGIRERSCHQCPDACTAGKFDKCLNNARCGCYRGLELNPKTAVPRASTRLHRENGALAFAEEAKPGQFFVSDQVSTLPWPATNCRGTSHGLPHTATHCHTLPRPATHSHTLPRPATRCHGLPHNATTYHKLPPMLLGKRKLGEVHPLHGCNRQHLPRGRRGHQS